MMVNHLRSPKKRSLEQSRSEDEELQREGGSHSPGSSRHSKARRDREASSPGSSNASRGEGIHHHHHHSSHHAAFPKTNPYVQAMDTDSPASHPKHVIVPSPPDSAGNRQHQRHYAPVDSFSDSPDAKLHSEKVVTPVLTHEPRPMRGGFDGPSYRPQGGYHYPSDAYGHYSAPPDMEMGGGGGGGANYGPPPMSGPQMRSHHHQKRWACDYCYAASFLSYEEACAHERVCAARHEAYYGRPIGSGPPPPPPPPPPQYHHNNHGGLGALYHASQEVQHYGGGPMPPPPPSPHQNDYNYHHHPHPHHGWHHPPGPPNLPSDRTGYPNLSPRFQDFRMYGNERRDAPVPKQRRMLLAMPTDAESLSDRQCYVRSEFVEVFAATEKDVAARHSKGAQKLVLGQVGIRCIHCSHLRPKDRAERAVCYPSSISRIYQTVADMQRFHFEQCREIPDEIRKIYKSLKTTRPRGVGSPQTYWIQSAKMLNLVDSDEGIRFGKDESKQEES